MSEFFHTFDDARTVAYDHLVDRFGADRVDAALHDALDQRVMELYDNRESLEVPADA